MNYFFVFQNKTFEKERDGGYLWAPQGRCSHWRNMCNIKAGDIIFHSYMKKIVAISIATSDCYDAPQPKDLQQEGLWDLNGWKVDCTYHLILSPIITSDYMDDLLRLQPPKYAPFNRNGRGNTGYLFNCGKPMADFLMETLAVHNSNTIQTIASTLNA